MIACLSDAFGLETVFRELDSGCSEVQQIHTCESGAMTRAVGLSTSTVFNAGIEYEELNGEQARCLREGEIF